MELWKENGWEFGGGRGSFVMPRVVNPSAVGNPNEEPVVAFAEIDPCPVCDGSGWRLRAQTETRIPLQADILAGGLMPAPRVLIEKYQVAVVVLEQEEQGV